MANSPSDGIVGDEEFLPVSGGDIGVSRLLRMQLMELKKGGNGVLKEMATEILSGRVGVREAARLDVYEEGIVSGIDKFKRHWDSLSPAEKREAEKQGAALLDELRERGR